MLALAETFQEAVSWQTEKKALGHLESTPDQTSTAAQVATKLLTMCVDTEHFGAVISIICVPDRSQVAL